MRRRACRSGCARGSDEDEEHERLFKLGVKLMSAGEYPESVSRFTQAIAATPGGLTSRLGGQYCIYLSQALQAEGSAQRWQGGGGAYGGEVHLASRAASCIHRAAQLRHAAHAVRHYAQALRHGGSASGWLASIPN